MIPGIVNGYHLRPSQVTNCWKYNEFQKWVLTAIMIHLQLMWDDHRINYKKTLAENAVVTKPSSCLKPCLQRRAQTAMPSDLG